MTTIKILTESDFQYFQDLIRIFNRDSPGRNDHIPDHVYLSDMLTSPTFHVLVAVEEDVVVGGLTAYEMTMYKSKQNEMFLYEIEVRQESRQRGVAGLLIETLKHICLAKHINFMYVLTSESNVAANRLYVSTGGTPEEGGMLFGYNLA